MTPCRALPCNFSVKYLPGSEQGLATSLVKLLLVQLQVLQDLVGQPRIHVADDVVESSLQRLDFQTVGDLKKALHCLVDPALLGLERVQGCQGRRLVPYQFIVEAGLNKQTMVNLDKQIHCTNPT